MGKIYVFDMGHVILKPSNLRCVYSETSPECSYEEFKKMFYNSKETELVYSGLISDDIFFKSIIEKSKSKVTLETLKKLYLKYKGGVYTDTINIMKKIKEDNNMICLLSNLKEIDYQYLNSVIDVNEFDKMYLSFLMNCCKPSNEIYEKVVKDLGTNDFYFFDDTEENILRARKFGIKAYNVTGDTIKGCFQKKLIKKI